MKQKFNPLREENYSGKLTFIEKFVYGLGRGNEGLTYSILGTFLLFYFTDVVGISPVAAAIIVLIPRLWDGINNPIMGIISDRTRSKWGRRIPYILWGSIPTGLFFFLLWVPMKFERATVTNLYYGFIFFMFTTAATMCAVPYYSLGLEMTTNYDERTSISNIRELIGMVFSLIAAVIPATIINSSSDPKKGFILMGATMAAASALLMLFVGLKVKERAAPEKLEKVYGIKEMFKPILQNKPFRSVTVIYFVYKLGCMTLESFMIYYLSYWLGKPGLLPVFMVTSCAGWAASTPFFKKIITKKGKRNAHIISLIIWLFAAIPFAFYPQNVPIWLALFNMFVLGIGWGTNHILPSSMLADVADLDELTTGQRREGLLYGTWSLFGTIAGAIALLPVTFILQKTGYVSGAAQPESTLHAIRLIMGFGNTLYLIVGIIATLKYDITEARHDDIRRQIVERESLQMASAPEQPDEV